MANQFPFVPALTFTHTDGVAHVLCGNGAHFVWSGDTWTELEPIPQSARVEAFEKARLRALPLEPMIYAVIDDADARGLCVTRSDVVGVVSKRTARLDIFDQDPVENAVRAMLKDGRLVEQYVCIRVPEVSRKKNAAKESVLVTQCITRPGVTPKERYEGSVRTVLV
jgi:hypothetical protein